MHIFIEQNRERKNNLFLLVMHNFVFLLLNVEEMVECGVDVEWGDEALLGVDAKSAHLQRMLGDEPLGEAETEHRLSFLDLALFRVSRFTDLNID